MRDARQIGPATCLLALLGVAAAIVVGSPVLAAQTFRSHVELVQLPVIVTGRDGMAVAGLTADDFEVVDNGQSQPIVSFAAGAPDGAVPLHLGVMLDRSPSMERDAQAAVDAVIRFVEAMPEAVDVTLVEFDSTVRISRFAPDSYLHLFTRIREGKGGDETALFDAIGRYLATTRDRPGIHVLVVYTDGGDHGRGLRLGEVQQLLREGNVLVYAIGYLEHQLSSDRSLQRSVLMRLTRETGGEAFFPTSPRVVGAIYERIRDELAARYTIGYALPADAAVGASRRVAVRLRDASRDGRRVRTRTGYVVAPAHAP